ncbi:MAG: MBL fold metallo-hydrolase [Acidaminococcus sp.]|jgi:L-ascorbate metabolism protein UlaG (beta-lactamase superfamily)|nr:MBL fold metallo-hydrolase [Acidaminococcus sp.]MCI2116743.1 MBL fold metallo-hydrolase [Acidaminococcus sp.]
MKHILIKILLLVMILLAAAAAFSYWFVHTPRFGYAPSGKRLERIKASPHYQDGAFVDLEPVTVMVEEKDKDKPKQGFLLATLSSMYQFILGDNRALFPDRPLPSVKTDLKHLDPEANVVVWMGHSSFYLQLDGQHILVDPVFSGYCSPLPLRNFRAYPGTDIYHAEDMPDRIDVMVISHNHWDHLDYDTQMALRKRVRHVVTPLGIGEDFERWGFDPQRIHEADWYESVAIAPNLTVHVLPSQHFSGRFMDRNQTEWGGFAFVTDKHKVYYSGDGGYGKHFKEIGRRFGGFDLAILENGQFNERWAKIHMMPKETAQAGVDVKAKAIMPVHNSKFTLSRHAWDTPLKELSKAVVGKPYRFLTPEIGEVLNLDDTTQVFSHWWEKV